MSGISKDLVDKAFVYVMELFEKKLAPEFVFHSKDHTRDVLMNSLVIGRGIRLSEEELNILAVAAIFHDAGYINSYADHEKLSCKIATKFLSQNNIDTDQIDQVVRAISATEVPQAPRDLISMALCDADLMHLAADNYFDQALLLKKEWQLTGRYDYTEHEFHTLSISFFSKHNYHTEYGRKILSPKKDIILGKIMERIS